MTNKQLYNLVFENFVQAKRELIREGYLKKTDDVDFNDVFNKTKHKLAEEKIKSLQRENEMLKEKLSKMKNLREAGSYSAAGQGGQFQGNAPGSEGLWNFITSIFAKFNLSRNAILDDEIKRMLKNNQIDSSTANIIRDKIEYGIKTGKITRGNIRDAIKKLIPQTLSESKKRRRY
jgi:hypothetical protein